MSREDPKTSEVHGDFAETRRIMERLVRTPPKPHKPQPDGKPIGKAGEKGKTSGEG